MDLVCHVGFSRGRSDLRIVFWAFFSAPVFGSNMNFRPVHTPLVSAVLFFPLSARAPPAPAFPGTPRNLPLNHRLEAGPGPLGIILSFCIRRQGVFLPSAPRTLVQRPLRSPLGPAPAAQYTPPPPDPYPPLFLPGLSHFLPLVSDALMFGSPSINL